jgi:hypothetical protein
MNFNTLIKKLPLKEKYISLLLKIIEENKDKKAEKAEKAEKDKKEFLEKGKITIQKYIIWSENKSSYEDFIQHLSKNLKIDEVKLLMYIGKIEDMLDKNTKVGVGYGIIYNFLESFNNDEEGKLLKDEVNKKLALLEKVYQKKVNKSVGIEKFYKFLDYINAQIYLNDTLKEDRYTLKDIKDINIEKDLFKDEIVINAEVFLTYLYKNILKIDKDENFILETIEKYPGYVVFLIQRIYRKYIDKDFEPEKYPDKKFEHIVVI